MTTVVVFGGGGFLGRRLVHRLTTEGMSVRVAVRHPDRARIELRSMGFDRVTVVPADVRDQASVSAAVAGANAVVNMVSAYVEKGGVTFEAVHVQGAETVARETVAAGVPRLVLVSGIGADADSRSPYIRARGHGEQVVQQTFPEATIVRPGAMFGPGDALFGTLAELARLLPILPLIGGGSTRLQPVFVEDVAEAIVSILTDPTTVGRTYELAGPGVYTLRELVSMTLHLLRNGDCSYRCPLRWPRSRRCCSSSCPTHRSPPAKLIFSRRTTSRAVPCRVSESSISNLKRSRR